MRLRTSIFHFGFTGLSLPKVHAFFLLLLHTGFSTVRQYIWAGAMKQHFFKNQSLG